MSAHQRIYTAARGHRLLEQNWRRYCLRKRRLCARAKRKRRTREHHAAWDASAIIHDRHLIRLDASKWRVQQLSYM